MNRTQDLGKYRMTCLLSFLLFSRVFSNPACIVDKCAVCEDTTHPTCTSCESGYYVKRFTSHEGKPFQDCWYSLYWWVALLVILIGLCLSLVVMYFLFRLGEELYKKALNKMLTEESSIRFENKTNVPRFEENPPQEFKVRETADFGKNLNQPHVHFNPNTKLNAYKKNVSQTDPLSPTMENSNPSFMRGDGRRVYYSPERTIVPSL